MHYTDTMKFIFTLIIVTLSLTNFGISQVGVLEDSLKTYESKEIPVYSSSYMKEYRRLKRLILKVYPYAIYAADLIDKLEDDVLSIEKRRKKNKFYKQAYKELRQDFKYAFLDMYRSEGRMLMKLVHRETGATVYDIAKKYRGTKNASVFNLMGKVWDQDLKAVFDPKGVDKIADHVISDIENGLIKLNTAVELKTKSEYREGMKEYRENKKNSKKHKKQRERKKKKDSD